MGRKLNLQNQTFGRLTVVREGDPIYDGKRKRFRNRSWVVKCECGQEKLVRTYQLRNGAIKSCGCSRRKLPIREAQFRTVFARYKTLAVRRNLEFSISYEQGRTLMFAPCTYCGTSSSNVLHIKGYDALFVYNGIDRWDNNLGYTPENCRSCCSTCNSMKSNRTFDAFISHVQKITAYFKEIK